MIGQDLPGFKNLGGLNTVGALTAHLMAMHMYRAAIRNCRHVDGYAIVINHQAAQISAQYHQYTE